MTSVPLAILIDTNIFVAAEQHADDDHPYGQEAAHLLRLTAELGFRVCLSQATARDVSGAPGRLGSRRRRALQKYHVLAAAPVPARVREVFGDTSRPQHLNDLQLVATYAAGVAQFLVTNDSQLRSRARRAGLERVLSLDEALAYLLTLRSPSLTLPPAADRVDAHRINLDAPLFDALKDDYPFEEWWRSKVVLERRDVLLVGEPSSPEAIAVLKVEEEPPVPRLTAPILKVCTFKVASGAQGVRRGELLLKSVVEFARDQGITQLYMEVWPHREELVDWLPGFGFTRAGTKQSGELIFAKALVPLPCSPRLGPLAHAVAYGPGSLEVERAHVVPIQNRWHQRLLPEASAQGDLLAGSEACGNAIRKAYVCRAASRKIGPGDTLLFLRTGAGPAAVTAVGVVERTHATRDPTELIAAVGTRTVYSATELTDSCARGTTLALLFRMDRRINPTWPLTELQDAGAVRGVPQSITELSSEGVTWLRSRLAESH